MVSNDMPFEFKRLQFPVVLLLQYLSIKFKVNRLKLLVLIQEPSCFPHGQLYVVYSRVGIKKNLYAFALDGKTRNIVYQTALQIKNVFH